MSTTNEIPQPSTNLPARITIALPEPVSEHGGLFISPVITEVITEMVQNFVDECPAPVVETPEQYTAAVEAVRQGREHIKTIKNGTEQGISLLHKIHAWAIGIQKAFTAPISNAIDPLDTAATRWWNESERLRKKREQEERDLLKRQQREQEQERQRLIKVEEDRLKKIAEDEQLKAAENAKALGDKGVISQEDAAALAEDILSAPIRVDAGELAAAVPPPAPRPAVVLKDERPKVAGRSYQKGKWVYEVIEGQENLIPDRYWLRVLNEKVIKAEVESQGAACKIPGLRIYQEDATSRTRTK